GQCPLGQAVHGVHADKVAALGPLPGGDAQGGDLLLQSGDHRVKLGLHDGGVLLHQLQGVGLVLQVADVAELVDLVVADGLNAEQVRHIFDVVHAGGHDADAGAGEGHLGGGGVLKDHVRVSGLPAQADDV